jgi:hypothetical protein
MSTVNKVLSHKHTLWAPAFKHEYLSGWQASILNPFCLKRTSRRAAYYIKKKKARTGELQRNYTMLLSTEGIGASAEAQETSEKKAQQPLKGNA